jgi:hypothetical protein
MGRKCILEGSFQPGIGRCPCKKKAGGVIFSFIIERFSLTLPTACRYRLVRTDTPARSDLIIPLYPVKSFLIRFIVQALLPFFSY